MQVYLIYVINIKGGNMVKKDQLIIPVYLNEKTVFDMLAIMEDGFSTVSEITNGANITANGETKVAGAGSANSLLEQLFKIQFDANLAGNINSSKSSATKFEKVHTNVSLFSKLRTALLKNGFLFNTSNAKFDFSKIKVGSFVEVEGELQKNPLLDVLEKFSSICSMGEIFSQEAITGVKKQRAKSLEENTLKIYKKQIKSFADELNKSGTIDYILNAEGGKLVLSLQEQYLVGNNNVSEIIGGRFKVLGKVIKVCSSERESIDLLRKTSLSTMNATILQPFSETFKSSELSQFNLPEVVFDIKGPSAIVIPIAVYI